MATFHFQIKSGRKGSAKDHASYIARKGFHGRRGDLVDTSHGNMPTWAIADPHAFWRAADKYERQNGAAYREAVIALPGELTAAQNAALVSDLIDVLADGKPYQSAVHAPASSLEGEKNPHLHLMFCDRVDDGIERPAERFFRRFNRQDPATGGRKKASGGLNRMELRDQVLAARETVGETINKHLERSGHDARVDHRSLREQGAKRRSEPRLGQARIRGMSEEQKAEFVSLREKSKDKAV